MGAVAFDTLKFVEKLEAGGFSPQQAKAAAQAFADATGEQLATKSDVKETERSLKADMKEIELLLKADIRDVKTQLDAKIEYVSANLKVEILRWLVVTQVALAGFIFAAIKFVK